MIASPQPSWVRKEPLVRPSWIPAGEFLPGCLQWQCSAQETPVSLVYELPVSIYKLQGGHGPESAEAFFRVTLTEALIRTNHEKDPITS